MQGCILSVLFSGSVYRTADTMIGDRSDQPTDNTRLQQLVLRIWRRQRHWLTRKTAARIQGDTASMTPERWTKTTMTEGVKEDGGYGTTRGGTHAVTPY